MSIAAFALALAVLVAPPPQRLTATDRRGVTARRPRLPLRWVAVGGALVLACLAPVAVTIAAAIATGTAVVRLQRRGAQRRQRRESEALQGALDVLVGEMAAGAHPVTAFTAAADESTGAVAESLAAVAARARLGADVVGGLRTVAARSSLSGHWERLAVCWQLAQAHGLGIATLVRAAQRDIGERDRFATRVDAGMAGARATASVLAGLPVLAVVLGELIGAAPVQFLLAGGLGSGLLVVGVLLACAGLLWSDRITAGAAR